jgi:hypothetical protein
MMGRTNNKGWKGTKERGITGINTWKFIRELLSNFYYTNIPVMV